MTVPLKVTVGEADFDPGKEQAELATISSDIGAIASFTGLMRISNEGRTVRSMSLEHYPGMTQSSILRIMQQASERWELDGATVIHRIGELLPGERIVWVGCASRHRGNAFQACEFIMDYLKYRAPFWKKEHTDEGDFWVDARHSDEAAAQRWE